MSSPSLLAASYAPARVAFTSHPHLRISVSPHQHVGLTQTAVPELAPHADGFRVSPPAIEVTGDAPGEVPVRFVATDGVLSIQKTAFVRVGHDVSRAHFPLAVGNTWVFGPRGTAADAEPARTRTLRIHARRQHGPLYEYTLARRPYRRLYALDGETWTKDGEEPPVPLFVEPGLVNDSLDGGKHRWRPAGMATPVVFTWLDRVPCQRIAELAPGLELPGPTDCPGAVTTVGLMEAAALVVTGGLAAPGVLNKPRRPVDMVLLESRRGR